MLNTDKKKCTAKKGIRHHRGRTYFSPAVERRFYFVATLGVMIAGILYKSGWL